MRVAFLTLKLKRGAIVKNNIRLAEAFRAVDIAVDFVVAHRLDEAPVPLPSFIDVTILQAERYRNALVSIARYLKRSRPDVIFVSGYLLSVICIVAAIISGTKTRVVTRCHEVTSAYLASRSSFFDRYLLRYVIQVAYPLAYRCVAVSKAAADDLARIVGPRRVLAIYNPTVSDDIYRLAGIAPAHQWANDPQVQLVVAVGRLAPEKDFPTMLRALRRVACERNVRLIVLGDGSLRGTLVQYAADIGVSDLVAFPGYDENPYSYIYRAKVFVSTSLREGLSNVIIEALALGCPVVSTNCVGGPPEILLGGACGILVPVGDDAAIADAILSLLGNKDLSARLSEAGKRRALDFSSEHAAQEFIKLARSPQ